MVTVDDQVGLLLRAVVLLCSVASICESQSPPRRRLPATAAPPIPPAAGIDGATELSVRFLPDGRESFADGGSFGERLTPKPRQSVVLALQPGPRPTVAAAPVRRLEASTRSRIRSRPTLDVARRQVASDPAESPDWTPIWPADRVASAPVGSVQNGNGSGDPGTAGDVAASVPVRTVAPALASPQSTVVNAQDADPATVDRAPVTEYYFSSSAAAPTGPTVPSVRLPTATFSSSVPTRRLPLPSASPRPVFLTSRPPVVGPAPGLRRTATRLADRLSALVTSRVAQTTIISPTPAAATDAPTSRVVHPPREHPLSAAIQTVDAPSGDDLALEPSTRHPVDAEEAGVTHPPTSAPPAPADEPVTVTPEEVDPTPASAPCVVTPQGPGGYCRNGDLLTVLTRDAGGNWEEYRVVRLPSATVAALDGEDGSTSTEDPVGVTESSAPETSGPATPSDQGEQATTPVSLPPLTATTTEASVQKAESAVPVTDSTVEPLTEPPVLGSGPTTPQGGVATTTERPGEERSTASSSGPTREPVISTVQTPTFTVASSSESDAAATTEQPASSRDDDAGLVEGKLSGKESEVPGPSVAPTSSSEETNPTVSSPTLGTNISADTQSPQSTTVSSGGSGSSVSTTQSSDEELVKTDDGSVESTTPSPILPSEIGKDESGSVETTTIENEGEAKSSIPSVPVTSPAPIETSTTISDTTESPTAPSAPVEETSVQQVQVDEVPTATTLPSGGAASTARTTWAPPGTTKGKVPVPSSVTGPPNLDFNWTRKYGSTLPTQSTPYTSSSFPSTTGNYDYDYNNYDYTTAPGFTSTGVSGYTTGHNTDYDYTTGSSGFSTTGFPTQTTTAKTTSSAGATPTNTPTSLSPPTPTDFTTPQQTPTSFTTVSSTNPTDTTFTTGVTTHATAPTTDYTSTLVPVTSKKPGITHSSVVPPVEVYVQFLVDTNWERFCQMSGKFRQTVVDLLNKDRETTLTADNAVLFNVPLCAGAGSVRARRSPASAILVFLYIVDADGNYDRRLTERVEPLWEAEAGRGPMGGLVREVDTIRPSPPHLLADNDDDDSAGVIVAVTVSCVAVASLVLLAVLLFVVRHRRRAAQAAQRCNPVSLEDYGVESVFSSMRRKNKLRRSVRSYLNQAFDDHDAPSNSVNFAGLANLSGDLAALKEEFDSIPTGMMPTLDDLPPGSEDKNRYANVLPVPETRVVLDQKSAAPNSDYINANYVRGPKDEPQFYIATQAPLESTVNDFWRMVWETQSKVIVCLTDIVERGVRRCAEYLPPSEALDRHRLYGDFQVTLMSKVKKDKYVVSIIQLKNMDSNLFREVTHLWYSAWPERGVPSDLESLVQFSLEARKAMKTNIGPTVVHCSPGTGRTGVLIAIDICVRQFDASRSADIMRAVFRVRQDRAGAVQTREQYALIYKVLNQYAASVTSGNLPALE